MFYSVEVEMERERNPKVSTRVITAGGQYIIIPKTKLLMREGV